MNPDELRRSLGDVAFTLATPFDAEENRVLTEELRRHVSALVDAGARLFVPCGNTGEYYSLSNEERIEVVSATVDAAGSTGTVVGGVGGSVETARQLLAAYEDAGADGAMIMHPQHVYMHPDGLRDYYEALLESTDLGIVLYKRGPEVTTDLLADLSRYERCVGVKYAVNDVEGFAAAVASAPDDVAWLNGIAERFAPAFALEGADGFTTGIGNFVPEAALELADAIDAEDWDRARRIRDVLRPYEELRGEADGPAIFASAKNVPAVKTGMDLREFYGGPVRPPLRDLSEEDERRAREYYERIREAPVIDATW